MSPRYRMLRVHPRGTATPTCDKCAFTHEHEGCVRPERAPSCVQVGRYNSRWYIFEEVHGTSDPRGPVQEKPL